MGNVLAEVILLQNWLVRKTLAKQRKLTLASAPILLTVHESQHNATRANALAVFGLFPGSIE